MSDLKPEPISGETGTMGTGPAASELSVADVPVTAAAEIESPRLAPEQEETSPKADVTKADAPKVEMPKVEAFKVDAPKVEAVKAEAPKVEAPKVEKVATVEKTVSTGKSDQKTVAAADTKQVCRRYSAAIAGLVDVPCE